MLERNCRYFSYPFTFLSLRSKPSPNGWQSRFARWENELSGPFRDLIVRKWQIADRRELDLVFLFFIFYVLCFMFYFLFLFFIFYFILFYFLSFFFIFFYLLFIYLFFYLLFFYLFFLSFVFIFLFFNFFKIFFWFFGSFLFFFFLFATEWMRQGTLAFLTLPAQVTNYVCFTLIIPNAGPRSKIFARIKIYQCCDRLSTFIDVYRFFTGFHATRRFDHLHSQGG